MLLKSGFSSIRRSLGWKSQQSLFPNVSNYHSFTTPVFKETVIDPKAKFQIYLSRSRDPYVNLSIEHFLLQKSSPDSTILFVYINSPCVVMGRNQNPWLETNLRLMRETPVIGLVNHQEGWENVQLVRRRSGGGTVFHDYGNVNYCVICPTASFTRDKHAEMVTRALRRQTPRARVNERHDIVLDQDSLEEGHQPDPSDMHHTGYHREGESPLPLKVSGSAYKLIRQRSLHHGTCLLASWNIDHMSDYLRSPAQPFIKARGVDSVHSPVANIHDGFEFDRKEITDAFQIHVAEAFADMYDLDKTGLSRLGSPNDETNAQVSMQYMCGFVGDEVAKMPEISHGMGELKSLNWIFGQTPQFALSSHPIEEDERVRPPLPKELPPSARVYLNIRSGIIISSRISFSSDPGTARAEAERFDLVLKGQNVQQIRDFGKTLESDNYPGNSQELSALAAWLDMVFGNSGR